MKPIFGTDGIRSRLGTGLFTIENLTLLGHSIALWATQKYGTPRILLVTDTRASCSFVKAALKSSLLLYPVQLFEGGTLSTPAAFYSVTKLTLFDCVLVISASHNAWYDNGLKIFCRENGKLSAKDEQELTQIFALTRPPNSYQTFGVESNWVHANTYYSDFVRSQFYPKFLTGITVALDLAHGALSTTAASLFVDFGATIIEINNSPTGYNINNDCGVLSMGQLQKKVLDSNADIGFAFDGDGDRVLAVNKEGAIKHGEDLLALLLDHPRYCDSSAILSTVIANQGLEIFVKKRQKFLIRTAVGDKHIVDRMQTDNLLLGGEPSGHIIMGDRLLTADGILTALSLLEVIILNQNWNMETFPHFPQATANLPVSPHCTVDQAQLTKLAKHVQEQAPESRIIVRLSGTEPLVRIVVEDQYQQVASSLVQLLIQQLNPMLI